MIKDVKPGDIVYAEFKRDKIKTLVVKRIEAASSKSKNARSNYYSKKHIYRSPFELSNSFAYKYRRNIATLEKHLRHTNNKILSLDFEAMNALEKKPQDRIFFRNNGETNGFTIINIIDTYHPQHLFQNFCINHTENKVKDDINLIFDFGGEYIWDIYVYMGKKIEVTMVNRSGNAYEVKRGVFAKETTGGKIEIL
jgi:hypothetical protein